MMQPRYYQIDAVNALYSYFAEKNGNPLLALPTGTGKSVIIAMFLQSVLYKYPGQRIIVLTHSKELIQQDYDKLISLWPQAPAGIYSAGLGRKESNKYITFAGIGTIASKAKLFGHIDIVVIDEAHMVSPNEETRYNKFLTDLKKVNPAIKIIGLTATPYRLGSGKLTDGGLFTDIAYDITGMAAFNRLVEEGYLANLVTKATRQTLDLTGVHISGGEYKQNELQVAVDKYEVTQAALKEVIECAWDRKHWLIFSSGIEHAIHISDMLNEMGISAIAIHSKMGDEARDKAISDFKNGKFRAVVNNAILTTGFDFPAIDCIVDLKPTQSTALRVQMLGRGTRPFPEKKNCLILDFAGNTKRLGPINDPVIPGKKGESKGGEAPIKLCANCNTYNHTSARNCVACGTEFVFAVKITHEASCVDVVKSDNPITENFKVDHTVYSRYEKLGRPPMMKVTYYCGLRSFTDYVCLEHDGFAQRKARIWWKDRLIGFMPETTDEALENSHRLKPVTHIRVWVNKKYPEIVDYCFDNSNFGKSISDTKDNHIAAV